MRIYDHVLLFEASALSKPYEETEFLESAIRVCNHVPKIRQCSARVWGSNIRVLSPPKRDERSPNLSVHRVDSITKIDDLHDNRVAKHLLASSTCLGTHICCNFP